MKVPTGALLAQGLMVPLALLSTASPIFAAPLPADADDAAAAHAALLPPDDVAVLFATLLPLEDVASLLLTTPISPDDVASLAALLSTLPLPEDVASLLTAPTSPEDSAALLASLPPPDEAASLLAASLANIFFSPLPDSLDSSAPRQSPARQLTTQPTPLPLDGEDIATPAIQEAVAPLSEPATRQKAIFKRASSGPPTTNDDTPTANPDTAQLPLSAALKVWEDVLIQRHGSADADADAVRGLGQALEALMSRDPHSPAVPHRLDVSEPTVHFANVRPHRLDVSEPKVHFANVRPHRLDVGVRPGSVYGLRRHSGKQGRL